MSDPTFIGLDPSLTGTGLARWRPNEDPYWEMARFGSTGAEDASLEDRRRRLAFLASDVRDWIQDKPRPDLVLIEGPAFSRHMAGTWDRAGLWWLLVDQMIAMGLEVIELSPTKLKKFATGRGGATKPDMRMALYKRLEIDERDDNKVDALWLAIAAGVVRGSNILGLPKSTVAVLEDV